MEKPTTFQKLQTAAIVILAWGAIAVPFVVGDDSARAALIGVVAAVVVFAPKLAPAENSKSNGVKQFGAEAGGVLGFFALFFVFSSATTNIVGLELIFASALFVAAIATTMGIAIVGYHRRNWNKI